jgi:hypothetical protein
VNCSFWLTLEPGPDFSEQQTNEAAAWDGFSKDESLRKLHDITDPEMQTLSKIALLGEARSSRDFLFILNTIRQALGE